MTYSSSLGRLSLAIPILAAAAFTGCEMDRHVTSDTGDPETVLSAGEAVVLSSTGQSINIDPFRTLLNVDQELRSMITFEEVMDAIVQRSGYTGGQTAISLYQQWWDTNNDESIARTGGPHCIKPPEPYNMYCPRQEGILADDANSPFINGGQGRHGYSLLSAVNRFDLAPANGAHCGEYRLTFGKNSGKTRANDRVLVTMEAQLPNPNPAAGLQGCRPVAQFWADLSIVEDPVQRAQAVKSFFFNGLPGFAPVIHPDHYGANGGGQIRTNQFMLQFMAQLWQGKEYVTKRVCSQFVANSCKIEIHNVPVAENFNPDFFSAEFDDPAAPAARAAFLAAMPGLLAGSLDGIKLNTPAQYNSPTSDGFLKRSDVAFRISGNVPLQQQITARLAELGETGLTWQHVAHRATTQQCNGCHQAANSKNLGNGLIWPQSNTFTMIDEARTESVTDDVGQVIGTRPLISPALKTLFLPMRKQALERFLNIVVTP